MTVNSTEMRKHNRPNILFLKLEKLQQMLSPFASTCACETNVIPERRWFRFEGVSKEKILSNFWNIVYWAKIIFDSFSWRSMIISTWKLHMQWDIFLLLFVVCFLWLYYCEFPRSLYCIIPDLITIIICYIDTCYIDTLLLVELEEHSFSIF